MYRNNSRFCFKTTTKLLSTVLCPKYKQSKFLIRKRHYVTYSKKLESATRPFWYREDPKITIFQLTKKFNIKCKWFQGYLV